MDKFLPYINLFGESLSLSLTPHIDGRSVFSEEKAAFESLIDSDEKLKKYVKEMHRAKATTHLAGREAWKKGVRGNFSSKTSYRNRLLVAAVFILLIGIGGIL